ncbi:MAG: hypothetical protein V7K47_18000 [Nostoc sp.]
MNSVPLPNLEKLLNPEATVVGMVFRENLKPFLEKHFTKVNSTSDSLGLGGVPVFFDVNQVEDCLIFEDRELLKLYLNRNSNDEFRIQVIAKSVLESELKLTPPQNYPMWGWYDLPIQKM